VAADIGTPQTTFKTVMNQQQHVAPLERSGYKVVYQRDGYVVLHNGGSGGSTGSTKASG
jgi:hypothetical protein